jgi:hypothetical protein
MSADRAITAALSAAGDQEVEIARARLPPRAAPARCRQDHFEVAELEVLDGSRNTLAKHHPVVIVEIHGNREIAVRAALGAVGYTRLELLDDGRMPHLLATNDVMTGESVRRAETSRPAYALPGCPTSSISRLT